MVLVRLKEVWFDVGPVVWDVEGEVVIEDVGLAVCDIIGVVVVAVVVRLLVGGVVAVQLCNSVRPGPALNRGSGYGR